MLKFRDKFAENYDFVQFCSEWSWLTRGDFASPLGAQMTEKNVPEAHADAHNHADFLWFY